MASRRGTIAPRLDRREIFPRCAVWERGGVGAARRGVKISCDQRGNIEGT